MEVAERLVLLSFKLYIAQSQDYRVFHVDCHFIFVRLERIGIKVYRVIQVKILIVFTKNSSFTFWKIAPVIAERARKAILAVSFGWMFEGLL